MLPHILLKKLREFFDSSTIEHGLFLMQWPANSPDLNPIEHLWAHLKLELHLQFPDTSKLTGPPETIKAKLTERLMKIWWSIDEEVLNGLISSMPHRVQDVIDADGWYTSY
jgi:DDE superfamily endonuclease